MPIPIGAKSKLIHIAVFLFCLLILNFILFVPQFSAYNDMWNNLPKTGFSEFDTYPVLRTVLIRTHFDIFRLNLDLLLVFLLMSFILNHKNRLVLTNVFFAALSLILIYNVYYEFSYRLYGGHPYFQNDLVLLRDVLPTFLLEIGLGNHLLISLGVGGLVLCLLYVLVFILTKSYLLINSRLINSVIRTIIVCACLLGFVTHQIFPNEGYKSAWQTVQWTMPRIVKSFSKVKSKHTLDKVDVYEDFFDLNLQDKPNVYLIFLESYGAVTFHSDRSEQHKKFVNLMDERLQENDWFTASNYSISPIIGGRSWLGFTSAICGLTIESQLQYNNLLENFEQYPHLVRWFNSSGYSTYRMKTMSNVSKSTPRLYQLSDQFYNFDTWIKHENIDYSGYEYDEYFGGIPDQYAMAQLSEDYLKKENDPYFTFFITMSSHIPWHPPPPIVSNHKILNEYHTKPKSYDDEFAKPDLERYHNSIEYTLTVMENYMIQNLAQDTSCIFIIVGDHQPPTLDYILENKINPFAVPIHIIARDSSFTESFFEESFTQGLIPENEINIKLSHAGFYSLLVNKMIQRFGDSSDEIPEIRLQGLK